MLRQWVFLSWQDGESLDDVIYANEPSAIDHRLARAARTLPCTAVEEQWTVGRLLSVWVPNLNRSRGY